MFAKLLGNEADLKNHIKNYLNSYSKQKSTDTKIFRMLYKHLQCLIKNNPNLKLNF